MSVAKWALRLGQPLLPYRGHAEIKGKFIHLACK